MNTTIDNRCTKTGHILLCPKLEGRTINVREAIIHND